MKRLGVCACLALLVDCGDSANTGAEEPIIVRGGTFIEGSLPGLPPLTDDEVAAGAEAEGPHVTVVESPNNVLRPGQIAKKLSGRATDDASSVAVRLEDAGTGYWVVPLGPADPAVPGELTWAMGVDVAADAPPGLHTLLLAAIDEAGAAGTEVAVPVCVRGPIPDGLHACDPELPPPAAVLSLVWDSDVDLDLTVFTPAGKFVDPKHPSTAGGEEPGEGDGAFDHDGFAQCELAGERRENLVFEAKPAPGIYYVFANLYDACAAPSARFTVSLHLAQGDPPEQVEVLSVDGEVLAAQANGGTKLGTFLTQFAIQ